jgi:hypothetical protein
MNAQIRVAVVVGTIAVGYFSGKYVASRYPPILQPYNAPTAPLWRPPESAIPEIGGWPSPGEEPIPLTHLLSSGTYDARGGREYALPSSFSSELAAESMLRAYLERSGSAALSGSDGARGGREFSLTKSFGRPLFFGTTGWRPARPLPELSGTGGIWPGAWPRLPATSPAP